MKRTGKPGDTVDLHDNLYELSRIKTIEHAKVEHYTWTPDEKPAIEEPKTTCRGEKSIQLYIMKVIRATKGKDWPKFMKDRAYKEKLRQQIHAEKGGFWCDDIAGTCACSDGYEAGPERAAEVKEITSVFPGSTPLTQWTALYPDVTPPAYEPES